MAKWKFSMEGAPMCQNAAGNNWNSFEIRNPPCLGGFLIIVIQLFLFLIQPITCCYLERYRYWVVLTDTKIQIWKQFTTATELLTLLYCCINWYKDTNLKAIHNTSLGRFCHPHVVLTDTKIQIWKQFTTRAIALRFGASLY